MATPLLAERPVHADIPLRHPPASSRLRAAATIMIHQLRIYEIFETNKAAFHARFRDHAARIMRKYGFQIAAMWETRAGDKTQFVYLLEWHDEATKSAAWSAFMSDAEWDDIKRVTSAEHGPLVGAIEDRLLRQLDYSPAAGRSLVSASPS
jgi:heme-degrading monooxygenase HmoA